MATTIVMPQMGYDMREGTVVRWHKKEGDVVSRGEVIAEIETDKATVEFEAYTSGVLRRIVAAEGVLIPVGQPLAVIADPDEELPEAVATAPGPGPAAASAPAATAPGLDPEATGAAREVRASPLARRLAQDRGIDLARVTGSGPGGRIVEQDVLEFQPQATSPATLASNGGSSDGSSGWVKASPLARRLARERGIDLAEVTATGPEGRVVERDILGFRPVETRAAADVPTELNEAERADLSRMRQTIARVTVDSKREAPHFYLTAEVDMTRAMGLRREINDSRTAEDRVSVNDLVLRACALALVRYPKFNAFFRGDHLELHSRINLGVAIALETGLIVPGISDCQDKSLTQIAAASKDLIARANNGTLRNEEYSDTTFSVSNLGMFDIDSFAAIIYPPHAAVLAVGAVKEQPVVRDGQVTVAQVMKATLSTDHRVADGAEGAQFLMEIKQRLENPLTLLL